MSKKETCPACKSEKYAKATDGSNKHFCSKCGKVWIPGAEVQREVLLKQLQHENQELKIEVSRLRAKLEAPFEPVTEELTD